MGNGNPTELLHPELPKRKNSLDDFELEIDQEIKELTIDDHDNAKVNYLEFASIFFRFLIKII